MRVLISSNHTYPARIGGLGSHRVYDALARGLAELGHEIYYHLRGFAEPLPDAVIPVSTPIYDVDILHSSFPIETHGKTWVRTCHAPISDDRYNASLMDDNFIFVSRSHAQSYGKERYVLNGINPSEYQFSEFKDDYFLFVVSGLERAKDKGLDIAMSLADELGFNLIVAGSSRDKSFENQFAQMCKLKAIGFVSEVYGEKKAELFAGAKALIFPTMLNEPFGLVIAEALISGTPVISSNNGACSELLTDEVGFICKDWADYVNAIERVSEISPKACRMKAMKDFHYLRMANDYVREYKKELAKNSLDPVK